MPEKASPATYRPDALHLIKFSALVLLLFALKVAALPGAVFDLLGLSIVLIGLPLVNGMREGSESPRTFSSIPRTPVFGADIGHRRRVFAQQGAGFRR